MLRLRFSASFVWLRAVVRFTWGLLQTETICGSSLCVKTVHSNINLCCSDASWAAKRLSPQGWSEMTGCSDNKIIKLLLIPSEDEFIKQIPHTSQVYIFFFFFFFKRKIMALLFSILFTRKKYIYSCGCGQDFIYTNEEEVCIFNRPTWKKTLKKIEEKNPKRSHNYTISTFPKTKLAKPVILGARWILHSTDVLSDTSMKLPDGIVKGSTNGFPFGSNTVINNW